MPFQYRCMNGYRQSIGMIVTIEIVYCTTFVLRRTALCAACDALILVPISDARLEPVLR